MSNPRWGGAKDGRGNRYAHVESYATYLPTTLYIGWLREHSPSVSWLPRMTCLTFCDCLDKLR